MKFGKMQTLEGLLYSTYSLHGLHQRANFKQMTESAEPRDGPVKSGLANITDLT